MSLSQEPSSSCIEYLTNHQFIKNECLHDFLRNQMSCVEISRYVCYCVGVVDGRRIVNALRILQQTPTDGVLSFNIVWYNQIYDSQFDSVNFWVHSGVALRKKFFMLEDRMSFLRSTFIYDEDLDTFIRLQHIWVYTKIDIISPYGQRIFNLPGYSYLYKKKKGKKKSLCDTIEDKKVIELKKNCKRLLKTHNHSNYLAVFHPQLFEILRGYS